jgi:hypothetical protein
VRDSATLTLLQLSVLLGLLESFESILIDVNEALHLNFVIKVCCEYLQSLKDKRRIQVKRQREISKQKRMTPWDHFHFASANHNIDHDLLGQSHQTQRLHPL